MAGPWLWLQGPDPAPEPEALPEEPAPTEPDGIAGSYVGTWRDDARGTSGGRCFMEIACEDGENYSIDIWWGSSAAETSHWQYTGTYDETWEGIDYIGTRYRETTQADGTVEQTAGRPVRHDGGFRHGGPGDGHRSVHGRRRLPGLRAGDLRKDRSDGGGHCEGPAREGPEAPAGQRGQAP